VIGLDPEWVGVIGGAVIVGVPVILKKLFDWRVDRVTTKKVVKETDKIDRETKKIDADAAQVIATTAVTLVAPLQTQINHMTDRIDSLERDNTAIKTDNGLIKAKFQLAIDHIRELRLFIDNHIPDRTPPTAPLDLNL